MTLLSRRRLLIGAAAAAAVQPAIAAPSAIPADFTLRVGTYRGADATLLRGTGLDHAPYRIAFNEFSGGNLITQAINAGALDLGTWSEIPLVFAAAADARVRVVATLEGPTANQAVLVPQDSRARSIADLRGRRVGYIRATTSQYFLIRMLAQHGLGLADIEAISLGYAEGLAAFHSGAIDAWATYGYAISTLEAQGSARVLQNAVGILSGNYLIGVDPDRLGDAGFRAAASDYIDRIGRAYAILDADKPRWSKLLAPAVSVPEPIALAYLREEEQPYRVRAIRPADIASAQNVADTFIAQGLLPKGTSVAAYFSDALLPREPGRQG